jgi:hypothetical protein
MGERNATEGVPYSLHRTTSAGAGLTGRTIMWTLVRRFLVLAALVFWQGGFTFYGAVVIPVGLHEIGRLQSQVTGPVTTWLNLAGLAALVPFAWDTFRRDGSAWRRAVRRLAWLGLAATLLVLFVLHSLLTQEVVAGTSPADSRFRLLHRAYLWVGTGQWACALVYAGASLAAWRVEDRQQPVGG